MQLFDKLFDRRVTPLSLDCHELLLRGGGHITLSEITCRSRHARLRSTLCQRSRSIGLLFAEREIDIEVGNQVDDIRFCYWRVRTALVFFAVLFDLLIDRFEVSNRRVKSPDLGGFHNHAPFADQRKGTRMHRQQLGTHVYAGSFRRQEINQGRRQAAKMTVSVNVIKTAGILVVGPKNRLQLILL